MSDYHGDEKDFGDAELLKFHHTEEFSGGSLYPNDSKITAVHPEHGQIGYVSYFRGSRVNSPILIKHLHVDKDHRRKGYGSALMDALQETHPKAKINHGDRTDSGKAWWKTYGQGADRRGRTASRRPLGEPAGQGVTIRYLRRSQPSTTHGDFGGQYAQHIEPAGRYMIEHGGGATPEGWDAGEVHFRNPLRIEFGGGYREPSNWKHQLHQRYDGATGQDLSQAIAEDGHDGIITHDKYGTNEIVDLTHLHKRGEKLSPHKGARREPIDMGKYFRGAVGAPHEIPGLFSGHRGIALDPYTWAKVPTEQVSTGNLYATQRRVFHKHLDRYRKGNTESDGGDLPWVVHHQGRNWVIDGHHRVVDAVDRDQTHIEAHVMRPRFGYQASSSVPDKRLFGPTFGLDRRLFDGDCLRDDVTSSVLGTLDGFWRPIYGPDWRGWARVYLAGSEASEWTSQTLEGNNDFDVLVGVDYEAMRAALGGPVAMMDDEQITAALNKQFRASLIPLTDPCMIQVDGQETGPWSQTWYVNPDSWDITKIKPYAAYDITNHRWAVKPPHLPDWSIEDFPQGHVLVQECRAVESYVRAVLKLPEPYRSQQADALWKHLHGDRGRAFGPNGEGWFDSGNVIEKWLDQRGIWESLAQAHFDAVADPTKLLAPTDWSNDPRAFAPVS